LPNLEHDFQKKVKTDLASIANCWHFTKEAAGLRGIPDLVGCIGGKFFALELKRSEAESRKKTGRIVLQRVVIDMIKNSGGFAEIAYPENWAEVKLRLIQWGIKGQR